MKPDSREPRLQEALRAMTPLTGTNLPEPRLAEAAPIVELLLDYSQVLRELGLGELEPAALFRAR